MAAKYYTGMTPQRLSQSSSVAGMPGPEIISMYNPEGMQQLIAATGQRQQRFDIAYQGVAAEKARIGELETYDKDALTNRLTDFETNINKLVQDKYNGDYSAAANEIAMKVASERSNPFYAFNKQKVSSVNTYLEDMRRIGPGFVATNDPRDVSYDAWRQGANLGYTPIDLTKVTQTSASLFQPIAKSIRSEGKWRSVLGGQYFEKTDQYGLKDEKELAAFLDDTPEGQAIVEEIYKLQPELAQVKNQDAVFSAIFAGGKYAIGTPETKTLADQGYGARMAGLSGGSAGTITPSGVIKRPDEAGDILSNTFFRPTANQYTKDVLKEMGINDINSYEELLAAHKKAQKTLMLSGVGMTSSATFPGGRLESQGLPLLPERERSIILATTEIKKRVKEDFPEMDLALQLYDINKTAGLDTEELNRRQKISDVLDASVFEHRDQLKPLGAKSGEALKAITDNFKVTGFGIDPKYGLYFAVKGDVKEKGGKSTEKVALVGADPTDIDFTANILAYLAQQDPRFKADLERQMTQP